VEICGMCSILLMVFIFLWRVGSSYAGGGQHYPNGAEDFMCGVAPGPGVYFISYSYMYTADEFHDARGKNTQGLDFDLRIVAEALRLVFFPGMKVLGGEYGFYFAASVYSADISAKNRGVVLMDDRFSGVGDVVFSPLLLGWHWGQGLHTILSLDLYAPTGHYNPKHPATTLLARNHWTFEPTLAITVIVSPGIDLSSKVMVDFHTTNDDYLDLYSRRHSLRPGRELHVDLALGVPLADNLRLGLLGYVYKQISDDEIDGHRVKDDRGFVFALGPGARFLGDNYALVLKAYHELKAKNRPQGYGLWLKIQGRF